MLNRAMLAEQVERVESLGQAVTEAEGQLEASRTALAEGLRGAEDELWGAINPSLDESLDEVLANVEIAEFAEGAMRVAGRPKRESSRTAVRLADAFDAYRNGRIVPIYYRGDSRHYPSGDFVAIQNRPAARAGTGDTNPIQFSLRGSRSNNHIGNEYTLRASGGGPLDIFSYNPLSLKTSDREQIGWTIGPGSGGSRVGLGRIDFATLKVIDDPEQARKEGWHSDVEGSRIYLGGEAVEEALTGDEVRKYQTVYDSEIVALLALIQASQGRSPRFAFADRHNDEPTHQERTLSLIAHYAGTLLAESDDRAGSSLIPRGLPVQLHELALKHQGIPRRSIGQALLKGMKHGGGAMRTQDVEEINTRAESGKKPRVTSKIIDRILLSRAHELQVLIKAVGSGSGLEISPNQLLGIGVLKPELLERAVSSSPRRGALHIAPENSTANAAIRKYFRYSSRFK